MSKMTEARSFQGANVVVTGGTRGIGRAIAEGFAQGDANLYIIGRDSDRGTQTQKEIIQTTHNPNVTFLQADVTSPYDRRRLRKDLKSVGVDYLIHSAGAVHVRFIGKRRFTKYGQEVNIATNLAGPVGLTHELQDSLNRASQRTGKPAHVWGISSVVSDRAQITERSLKDPTYETPRRRLAYFTAYPWSKRAYNFVIDTMALVDPDIQYNNINPGVTRTDFNKKTGGLFGALYTYPILRDVTERVKPSVPPSEVAKVLFSLLQGPELQNGATYTMEQTIWQPLGADFYNPKIRNRLWEITNHLAKIPLHA